MNPLNARKGWRAVWAYSRDAKRATAEHLVLEAGVRVLQTGVTKTRLDHRPKRVTFTAYVFREWDDDNLRAALKPHRDALKDVGLITDDAPSSGNVFEYRQKVERPKVGVEIVVEPL